MGQQLRARANQPKHIAGPMTMMVQQALDTQLEQPVAVELASPQALGGLTQLEETVEVALRHNVRRAFVSGRLIEPLASVLLTVDYGQRHAGMVPNAVADLVAHARQWRVGHAVGALFAARWERQSHLAIGTFLY